MELNEAARGHGEVGIILSFGRSAICAPGSLCTDAGTRAAALSPTRRIGFLFFIFFRHLQLLAPACVPGVPHCFAPPPVMFWGPIAGHFFSRFRPSLARRSAVRFFAAAVAAFFARADRSSAVIVSRLRLPPLEPIAAIACRMRSRDNLAMPQSYLSA